ncbi:MAG: Fic family protein [Candidatus Krumholzibacteriota bacterium]|nr:Fic family protein [Candidatus Krumholzibacteriota bacterium]
MVLINRRYERSHPWLDFQLNMREAPPRLWMLLGQAVKGRDNLISLPINPLTAHGLYHDYRVRGLHSLAALEGNTLVPEEVAGLLVGESPGFGGEDARAREIRNIARVIDHILDKLDMEGGSWDITPPDVLEFNRLALDDIPSPGRTGPGMIRSEEAVVMSYRGAPPEDCEYLLERLCKGLAEIKREFPPEDEWVSGIIRGLLAHIYLFWIQPCGSANGLTARLAEFQVMLSAGIPETVLYLLQEYYHKTQQRYFALLTRVQQPPSGIMTFLEYALRGLGEGLGERFRSTLEDHEELVWDGYLRQLFGEHTKASTDRQRALVQDISRRGEPVPVGRIRQVSPRVAGLYAGLTDKTVSRDLNVLLDLGLVERSGRNIKARLELLREFPSRGSARKGERGTGTGTKG